MTTQNIIPDDHQSYIRHLEAEERSPGTVANYLRHLRAFARWLDGAPVEKSSVVRWKTHLLAAGYTPATINGMLASLHSYFHFRGWAHCRVRYLRVQRKLFRDDNPRPQPLGISEAPARRACAWLAAHRPRR